MSITAGLYRRILKKLNLSRDQLFELDQRLNANEICAHSFIGNQKMCPNTTALWIKQGKQPLTNSRQVKSELRQHGITGIELIPFYLVYDVPSILSKNMFKSKLKTLRSAVEELLATS